MQVEELREMLVWSDAADAVDKEDTTRAKVFCQTRR